MSDDETCEAFKENGSCIHSDCNTHIPQYPYQFQAPIVPTVPPRNN